MQKFLLKLSPLWLVNRWHGGDHIQFMSNWGWGGRVKNLNLSLKRFSFKSSFVEVEIWGWWEEGWLKNLKSKSKKKAEVAL